MKEQTKYFLFNLLLIAILGSVFVISTSAQPVYPKGIQITKTVSCDYQAPVLGPWYDCNAKYKGDLKLNGWKTETCSKDVAVFISDNELRDRGYVPIPVQNDDPTFWDWDRIVNNCDAWDLALLWFLGWLTVLLLIVLLWKFLRGDFDSKVPVATNPASPASPSPAPSSQTTSVNFSARAEAMQKVLKSMKDNDMEGSVDLGEGVTGNFAFKKGSKTEKPKAGDQKPAEGQDKKS